MTKPSSFVRQIKELGNLVKESRTDLETLRAKFTLNQKIARQKEQELKDCVNMIDKMEEEVKELKEQVFIIGCVIAQCASGPSCLLFYLMCFTWLLSISVCC